MKRLKKTPIHVYFVLLSIFFSSIILAQPCGTLNTFSSSVTTGPSQASNTWYTDRYAPKNFGSPSTDVGGSALKESISTDDGTANRPTNFKTSFYNTQGRRYDLIAGAKSIEVKLYVPSNWASSNKRMAGLWGAAYDAGNTVSAFPIVEFTSDGTSSPNPRFRGFESGDGSWKDMGLPTGFTYDSWVTIRIALLPTGEFTYTVGDLTYTTTTNAAGATTKIGQAILQGYNYNPTQPLDDVTNTGVTYDIYWDDFVQSIQTDGLLGFKVKNVNTGNYYCTIQSAINDATVNDSLTIAAGTYNEQLSIDKTLRFGGSNAGNCGTAARASETILAAPTTGSLPLLTLVGGVTASFDGFKITGRYVTEVRQPNQNLSIKNSVFELVFNPGAPGENNIFFESNALTLQCNYFKAVNGTNPNGNLSHIFMAGGSLTAINNTFTSQDAENLIVDHTIPSSTTSLPVWLNVTSDPVTGTNSNNGLIEYNLFTKVDVGILLAANAGNITIRNNEFSEAKRQTFPFGNGFGAGIAIFDNYTPSSPVYVKNNKFYNSETGIRTSTSGGGTTLPDSTKFILSYNSFTNISEKAINIGSTYSGSATRLNAKCNWFGAITGPYDANNTGGVGQALLDPGGRLSYKNWLVYGTDADAGTLGFQLPTNIAISPGDNKSQAENHYRILSNTIGCAVEGQTIALTGTFDFSDALAKAEWAKGNNGLFDNVGSLTGAGGDDYTITAPDSANHVTITTASLGTATIHGPGDLDNVSFETPLFIDNRTASSSHKKWTISNLIFDGFDLSFSADNNGGSLNAIDSLTVTNNRFNIPADWNANAKPQDNYQNIGLYYTFGKAISITNNQFFIDGTGTSSDADAKYSSSYAIQSATSGNTVYDGLKIINNTFTVTGVPDLSHPSIIRGIWENGNNNDAAILIDSNKFTNDNAGNIATKNRQTAFFITSFSGPTNQVIYRNNEVTGYYEGFGWLGGSFNTYTPEIYAANSLPVQILNNKLTGVLSGVVVRKNASSPNTGSPAFISNNSFSNYPTNGVAIRNEGTGATDATCNWYDTVLVGNVVKSTGGGSVTFIPRLSNGNDASVATGFQLDGSNTCFLPVINVTKNNASYATIQAAVDAASANDSIFVTEGIYPENVVVNKALKITGKDSALVIVDKGDGNYGNDITNIGFSITANNVSLKKIKVRNYGVGVRVVGVNTILIDSMSLVENYNYGFYTNQSLDSLEIKNSTLSYNGNKGGVKNMFSSRGIFTQSTAADFSRFNIHDNLVERNGLTGIDINSSHSTNGLTIQNNISRYNFDEQIGVWLGNTNETMKAVLVQGNTLTLTDSAHYGMEVRMPHGITTESGNGSVLIQNNTISIVNPANSVRDKAAIAVIRRKDESDATVIANDQPQGVVIKNNTISDFQNASNSTASGSAFGIVVGGIGHKIVGNTINNTQISIQLQKGNEYAATNDDSGSPAVPNNEYFDRDNSSDACAEIGVNTISGSSAPRLVTGPTLISTPPIQYVTNLNTTVKFCTIQSAIDYPSTVNGNIIDAAATTYTENITVNKSLILQGPNQTNNPNTGTRVAEATVIPATNDVTNGRVFNVTEDNVTIKGFTIDGHNANLSGTAVNALSANASSGIATGVANTINGNSNLIVENNILQNFSNAVAPNYGAAVYASGAGSAVGGGKIRNNKIDNANFWGIYTTNNFYADIQNNIITRTNRGIQVENNSVANSTSPTLISGNTLSYYKRGITMNLLYGSATPYTISNNTIMPETNGTNEDGATGAIAANKGIVLWSYAGANSSITDLMDNKINGANTGIEFWATAAGRVTSTGDSVLNSTDAGILVNTSSNYGSAANGSFAIVTKATVLNTTNDGVRIIDNDGNQGSPAQINLTNSFVTGGVNNIAITGPEIDATTVINSNSLTGANNKSIIASSYTGANINATCNWLGGPSDGYIASRISGNITYLPALASGVDSDPATKGFQPAAICTSVFAKTIFVNDNSSSGDVYTNNAGNDASNGTADAPFATISHAINVALAGDTIYVDAGNYVDTTANISILINKKLTILGPNAGVAPNNWAKASANIYPQTVNTDVNTGVPIIYMSQLASGSKLDGLVIDGHNPYLSGGTPTNGVNVHSVGAIQAYDGLSNVAVQNNIIQNFTYGGIVFFNSNNGGAATSGNTIFQNNFDNIFASSNAFAVLLYNNCYTDVVRNNMTRVRVGVQTGNFNLPDTGSYHSISKNNIQSQAYGIYSNLHYQNATNFIIRLDTLSNFLNSPDVQSIGIRVQSMQDNVGLTILNNAITGNKYGVALTNNPTTNTITVKGGSITGSNVGIWATNALNSTYPNASPSNYIVDSVNIQNTSYAGIEVTDSSINANGSTVALSITNKTIINNTATGLLLQGKKASASFTGATSVPASFTGQIKYIDQITNGTNVPGNNIDATAVSFDGQLGSAMDLPTLYNTEEKINHKIDADSLGFVLVKANNAYVTPLSFIAPVTTSPKIQRGVNASSNGFNINVAAGTYAENLIVNKSVSVLGAQIGQSTNSRIGSFIGQKANPATESIITAPIDNITNDNSSSAKANDLVRVLANNIKVDGFTIDGNNPAITPTASTLLAGNGLAINARHAIDNLDTANATAYKPINNLLLQNNIIQNVAQRGVFLRNEGPVSTGNLITANLIRSFGSALGGGQGIILFSNAYANITNNKIDVPHDQIGLHLQNFSSDGSMTWSGNNVTVGQNGIGIHTNLFYPSASTFTISGNTVNAADGVSGTNDSTWGINLWSVQNGSTVNVTNNTVGSIGGTFARGINIWNSPTSNPVTVNGGTIANSVVGINLDNVDLYNGSGSTTIAKVNGTNITAVQSGVRARAASLSTPPSVNSNTASGSVSLMLNGASINVTGTAKGVEIVAPASASSNMATVYLSKGTTVNNTTTSDTAVLINGNQAQLYADTSNIKMGSSGAHNAIQFANITSGNIVSNLVLAGGTTINRNGNLIAKAFASPQYSIVEMDAPAPGWTAPDSTVGGNQSILIDGAMKFTSGNLVAGNSTIEFGTHALDIMTSGLISQEKVNSYLLGNARMLSRPVGMGSLDMLGVRLAAQTGTSADVGNMSVLRTTLNSGSINPAFPGNNSIRTTWLISPDNTTSSRSDVEFRYLNNPSITNGQNPSSIYSYRYSGGVWNKVSASLSSNLVGDVYTTSSFGVPGFSPWTLSSQSTLDAPDMLPFITLNDPNFTSTNSSQPITISVFNSGPVASTAAPIVLTVLKPSRQYSTLTLTNDATGNGAWTIVDHGSFYTITSNASPVVNGNFGSVSITANLNILSGISNGTYNLSVTLSNNTGGEINNSNNSTGTAINVNN